MFLHLQKAIPCLSAVCLMTSNGERSRCKWWCWRCPCAANLSARWLPSLVSIDVLKYHVQQQDNWTSLLQNGYGHHSLYAHTITHELCHTQKQRLRPSLTLCHAPPPHGHMHLCTLTPANSIIFCRKYRFKSIRNLQRFFI